MKGKLQKYMLRMIISDENRSGFGISKEIMREKFTSTKFVVIFFPEGDYYIIIYNKRTWEELEEGKGRGGRMM